MNVLAVGEDPVNLLVRVTVVTAISDVVLMHRQWRSPVEQLTAFLVFNAMPPLIGLTSFDVVCR